ncbi:UNKNOWN [Stylonychia lemnae]|uniref:Uncharacterized protein n=1 Tax=Stylonychia lemnae TaxID=5949 RepID=A0A078B3C3_STYLE|nr:UNKNOWN [Stylonychia lemnae]|eukprot:CDW87737.1 UNKNOWN [Stylonychia lemnae]
MIVVQNFARENLVIYYDQKVYTQNYIVDRFEKIFEKFKDKDTSFRLYFEETFPPKFTDYFIYLYSDDDKKSELHHKFFSQLSERMQDSDIVIGRCDLTSSIFWGIWRYGLPYVRFYGSKFEGNFQYVYDGLDFKTYNEYIKNNSPRFGKKLDVKKDPRVQGDNPRKYYWKRHCENRDRNPKLLMDWFLYEIVDYDEVVEQYLQEKKYQQLPVYTITTLGQYKGKQYDQPYFIPYYRNIGKKLKVVMLGQPQYKENSRLNTRFLMREEFMAMGISSFRSFPVYNKWEFETDGTIASQDRDYNELTKLWTGWFHNSRNPARDLAHIKTPRLLFAHSDLMFVETMDKFPNGIETGKKDGYDVVMSILGNSSWHEDIKNWTLAVQCYEKLAETGKYKLLLIGRELPPSLVGKVDRIAQLPQEKFFSTLAKAQILLVPSISDASPRVITQALTMNAGIIVNQHIVGGWKYVNEQTGAFVDDFNDIVRLVEDVKRRRAEGILQPRKWFAEFSTYQYQRFHIMVKLMWHRFNFDTDINGFETDEERYICLACQ